MVFDSVCTPVVYSLLTLRGGRVGAAGERIDEPAVTGPTSESTSEPLVVQRSLRVGSADDPLEREADLAADAVMRMISAAQRSSAPPAEPGTSRVQRSSGAHEMSTSPAGAPQRVRRRATTGVPLGREGGGVSPEFESGVRATRGGGSSLPAEVGRTMEHAFDADFSNVRIHTGSRSHELSRSINAEAFATGSDIYLGESAPSVATSAGTRLLAHELAHVVQQNGRVQRSSTGNDVVRRLVAPPDNAAALQKASESMAAHKRDRAALVKIVKKGAKSKETRTRNACEWILDGRTKLYALNATGDHTERINHLGHPLATTETWFPKGDGGAGDVQSGVAMYNPFDLSDQTNVCVDTDDGPSTNGWNGDGFIAVMMRGGQMSEAEVLETLRHEVQHDADKNREKQQAAVAIDGDTSVNAVAHAQDFEGYKTEYRAYNYQALAGKGYNKLSPTKVVTKYGFKWTQRQLAIFEQIHDGYDHTQRFWDNSFQTQAWATANPGETGPDEPSSKGNYHGNVGAQWQSQVEVRRQALVDYVNPDDEGFNKYDSIRVDDFYNALDAVPVGTSDSTSKLMYSLMWKTGFLQKNEAKYILEESPDMRKKMKTHLFDEAYVSVHQGLCSVAGIKKATPLDKMGKHASPTIQKVSDALDAVPVGTSDATHPSIRTLRFATAKLTRKEAKQVLGHESKLLNKIDRQLAGQVHTDFMKLIQDCIG